MGEQGQQRCPCSAPDPALYGVIMEAYISGISTRKVDALVSALSGQSGISKSQVSLSADIDVQVQACPAGLWMAAVTPTCVSMRPTSTATWAGRCRSAPGLSSSPWASTLIGRRELLGPKVGDSESEAFWGDFIGSLKERGLTGVRLVISDAHKGLTNAIRRMLQGSSWQRCKVHYRCAEGFA